MSKHNIVWIDHHEARIMHLSPDDFDEATVRAPASHVRRHPRGSTEPTTHPDDAKRFFHDVAQALEGAQEILVVGPGTAKLHFIRHVHEHEHELEPKLVGVETVDHPSDAQLVAYARKYFVAADRMR